MSLTKLPDGSFLDVECNPVGAIFKQARPASEDWVVVVMTKMAQFIVPCADEAEADAQLGALAARLGYSAVREAKDAFEEMRARTQ
jgi:hypothetical protein